MCAPPTPTAAAGFDRQAGPARMTRGPRGGTHMSQADWDRSTIGGAGLYVGRRRMLGTAAVALAAGLACGAGLAFMAMKHQMPQMPKAGGGNMVVTASSNTVATGA